MKKKSVRAWVRENREMIDSVIARELGRKDNPTKNDDERYLWTVNFEYLWNLYNAMA